MGLIIRSVILAAVFVAMLLIAALSMDHAIRRRGYLGTSSNGDFAKLEEAR